MKNVTGFIVAAAIAALLTTAADAVTIAGSRQALPPATNAIDIRLVCDQACRCWSTGYIQQSRTWKAAPGYQDPNYCPGKGYYNGYYRTGPGIGLGFDSPLPATHVFPF